MFAEKQTASLSINDVAQALIETHRLVYFRDLDELCEYEKGVYQRGVEKALAHHAEAIEQNSKNQFINEVIGKIKRRVRPVKVADFESNPYLVNVKNGVLDLRNGQLSVHTPAALFLNQLDIEFDPSVRSKRFERFMASVIPGPADRMRLVDHFASCLVRVPIKRDLMCVGETDSGKSTFLSLVRLFLGSDNVSSIALQELESDRFATADLLGKLANIHADIDDQELKRTSRFKTSNGSDQIRAQRKHGHPFFFVPFAKQFYSANHVPATKDESEAFFNRWNVVFFSKRFVDEPSGQPGESKRDSKLLEKLLTPRGKSGILNVLAARAMRIVITGEIPNSESIAEVRDLWLYHSDFIENFLRDNVEPDSEGRVPKAELYHLYANYCSARKITPKSKQEFNARVERRGAIAFTGKLDHENVKLWKGINMKKNSGGSSVASVASISFATNATEKRQPLLYGLADGPLSVASEAITAAEWVP